MAEWNQDLPNDGEDTAAGDPGHPDMHNDVLACIVELRNAVDDLPTPSTPDADDISVDHISGTSGSDVQAVLEGLASRIASLEDND